MTRPARRPVSNAPATVPVMLKTSKQTSWLETRCGRSPGRTVADSTKRNTPLTDCHSSTKPWVVRQTQLLRNKCHALHGCRCDRCKVLGNKRRFASRGEAPTTTGSQDIECQPANREKAAHPRRDCRHDAGIDRHMGRDTLGGGEKHVADAGSRDAESRSGRHALQRVEKHQRLDGLAKLASGARESSDQRGRPQPSETVGKSTVKQVPDSKANRRTESTYRILRLSHRWRSRCRQMPAGRY